MGFESDGTTADDDVTLNLPSNVAAKKKSDVVIEVNKKPKHGETKRHQLVVDLIRHYGSAFGISVKSSGRREPSGKNRFHHPIRHDREVIGRHVDNFRIPWTIRYEDYHEQLADRTIVVKNERRSRGAGKYFIETDKQFDTFVEWMDAHGDPDDWSVQEYIPTPSNRPTSFKIAVDCTGSVLAAWLAYSAKFSEKVRLNGATPGEAAKDPMKLLECPDSEFYLNALNVSSTKLFDIPPDVEPENGQTFSAEEKERYMVGGRIVLDGQPSSHPISRQEQRILRSHGIEGDNPVDAHLPQEVFRLASDIGREIGIEDDTVKELFVTVDIVLDESDGKYKAIDINRRSGLVGFQDVLGSYDAAQDVDVLKWVIGKVVRNVSNM